jgi:anaerobic ribonucleoside-triphosphate reductase activating protein
MLKYVDSKVVFAEIPDEITLAINISNCPCHCEGCHSPYLADDIGKPLDLQHLTDLIDSNRGITCVCIMGGDANPSEVDGIAQDIKEYYPNLKVGWYSGRDYISKDIDMSNFNYIKYGHYDKDKGPLNSKTTNQVMLEIDVIQGKVFTKDITAKFWNVSY